MPVDLGPLKASSGPRVSSSGRHCPEHGTVSARPAPKPLAREQHSSSVSLCGPHSEDTSSCPWASGVSSRLCLALASGRKAAAAGLCSLESWLPVPGEGLVMS